ncbi:ABC transporter permease subunit [Actinosynnema pretiosum subsp. pretiosum]|uniref:Binding-protein-dependent transport systems inner membrane component n=2 Tax=Actinosynnema TaxID=40566 RepID=C6WQC7_ACTMD|nr:ABC transporter permease subunit [Actinosynnema mirum]ACU36781.1 binding-protein-dependent transport systems inner membrane component [Actinosynnema mirum DSM 43827]AXX30241.1 Spermidine Putrescine ABC transporter permease component PotB [Actinosynnema pretiosum subsp. pretiosum]QUF05602.1 ABC transporter permease subunit [Actinosynnema pretiosum subsp. pretiosum]
MSAPRRRLAALLLAPGTAFLVLAFCSIVALLVSYSTRTEQTSTLFAPFDLGTWQVALSDGYLWSVVGVTMRLGLTVSLLTVLIAYPLAWCVHTMRRPWQAAAVLFVVFSPILVSVVVRSYGWAMLLRPGGVFGDAFDGWLYHEPGVIVALVHVELPFALFAILASVRSVPADLAPAAADLGAGPVRRFTRILLPLTLPGVLSGAQLVFALTISAFATPALLGGGRVTVLAQTIYQNIQQLAWPLAAVQAVVLLALTLVVLTAFTLLTRLASGRSRAVAS